jgi:hypothetical protein
VVGSSTQALVLQRAAEDIGGVEILRDWLGVTDAELKRWMDGEEIAPTPVFNKAVRIASRKL